MIRVVIEYHDAATTIETWPSVYNDREQALRFIGVMEAAYSGVISSIHAEVWCADCGEWELEDEGVCQQCGFEACRLTVQHYDGGDRLCPTCTEDRDDDTSLSDPHWRGVSLSGPI